ncbi:MAG: chemotaxis protein CheA [Bacteroidales bacterium]|nr:chemotaxis protein CheA [Bacteroidales bacterium]
MTDSGKYLAEAQSIMLNLKKSVHEFEKNPDQKGNIVAIHEALSQLGDLAIIYGMNSVEKLTSKFGSLLLIVSNSEIEANDELIDISAEIENLIPKIAADPLLKEPKLRLKYDHAVVNIESLMVSGGRESDEDAEAENKCFQDIFSEEAFDVINQLEEKMLQLESDPKDEQMIDDIFRIMHTLKGNSNMFGYEHLGEITHQLENVYDNIRSKKEKLTRSVLEITLLCIDHFRNLIDDMQLNDPGNRTQQETILDNISAILGGDSSASKKTKKDDIKSEEYVNETEKLKTYYIFFKPSKDVFNDGTSPLYIVYDLHDLGDCRPFTVFGQELDKKTFSPDQCVCTWHILVCTKSSKTELEEHFMFLADESKPKIKVLDNSDLIKNEEFFKYFRSLATAGNFLDDIEVKKYIRNKKQDNRNGNSKSMTTVGKEAISSVRVASQKIDSMMNLISELLTKQAELALLSDEFENQKLTEVAESIENISRDLRDLVFSISLIPLDKSVLRFQRLVRDVSNRFNKKVDFIVEGKETELDKTIIEKIIDPIMHILRNSIDHGIESPEERKKKGKPETGTIVLKAYPSGAYVVIEISDDGSGINLNKVKSTALERGMIDDKESVSREDLLHMIVSPGFSTAENISEVSGRGVGMDVVNHKISEIRGELEIKTKEGKGTTVTIKLPLTISIIDSLLVTILKDHYIIPLSVVEKCDKIKSETILKSVNRHVILNEEYIPFVDLRDEFSIDEDRPENQQVVLVRYKEDVVALVVDEIVGNYQAVLKSLGDAYKRQEIISGASILGSGEVALMLDTNKIIQEFNEQNELKINEAV